jgi:hypothetical protein
MKRTCYLLVVLMLVVLPTTARADGLLYQLPEDGSWVRYDMTMEFRDGPVQKTTGSLTMMITGTVMENGKKCRWIEFKSVKKRPDRQTERTELIKVLVPEENLKTSKAPTKNRVRGWRKRLKANLVRPLTETSGDIGLLYACLANSLENAKELEAKELDTKLGKLKCEGVSGSTTFRAASSSEVIVTMENRLHAKSPFGVVWSQMKFQEQRRGTPGYSTTVTLTLSEIGKNAKSMLPDSK